MSWLTRLLRRGRLERQLDAELRDHLERQVADYVRDGMSEADARRRARLEFGGLDQIKELCRDARGTRWFEDLLQDVRYGYRSLRRVPGFTAVVVATLALGIGTNVAIFGLIDALLLRSLPVRNPQQLIALTRVNGNQTGESFSYPQIRQWAEQQQIFSGLAGYSTSEIVNVGPTAARELASASWVSGNYYTTLGLVPVAGRLLEPRDDEKGAALAAVITDSYWTRRFGRDPNTIGHSFLIEGMPVTIVGVSPRGFAGAVVGEAIDLALPIQSRPLLQPDRPYFVTASARWLRVLARPREGLSVDVVLAQANVLWAQWLEAATPRSMPADARARRLAETIGVRSGETGSSSLRHLERPLVVTMGLVGLVLLMACVNVANLLLARATTRQREIALRLAIGAGRGRIIRQLLTESGLLAIAGAVLGVFFASLSNEALINLMAGGQVAPDSAGVVRLDLSLNPRVFAFAVLTAALTTLFFGAAPAFRASMLAPGSAVNAGSTRIVDGRTRSAALLVTAQVALGVLLVTGAGLFARTLHNLRTLDRGFSHDNVLLVNVDQSRAGFTAENAKQFNLDSFAFARQLPGVAVASLASITPLQGGGISQAISVNGQPTGPGEIHFNLVGPDFFAALQSPVVIGREFTAQDTASSPRVAIVNETFARRFMAGVDPLGQRVAVIGSKAGDMQVVGVVKDAVYESLRDAPPPTVYAAFLQRTVNPEIATLVIRAPGALDAVAAALRAELEPKLVGRPLSIRLLVAQVEASIVQERMMATVSAAFGLLALMLAAVGLYGLLAYWVVNRTREIGVRLALGSSRARVVRLVLSDAMWMLGIGTVLGVPAAWVLSRLVSSLLFGVGPNDPATVVAAALLLIVTGLAAALIPARRATGIDPQTALRTE
jgi:predicted permease